ncbi:sugar phosphate isomerase/epimerase family protein [Paenibacillus aurantius]|uniref:Sugar phosphate isomerase/epimerase family protein n=1 Tax=Paenibacillus aurantius TaxID=2918900 RepID=A0AA96RE01_9BACL|nr:sugar phosphate isomerase/epimerase family protein [Paenibacillus aurantius]WJH36589.1 sugar phosphate isomerase/epimerase [Paenibacillus sp. CC-CFT747]WNQ11920.1 sugar phosphate isomerase/epimerase family protein [Paenibacillus aurantius]
MALSNKIGVIADSFRLGVRDGLKAAKEVGADGVQLYAVKGEMDPDNLSTAQRKELKDYIASLGLEISALCGDMGGGFHYKEQNAERVEKSKRILDLAVELGTNVVTTHIGVVPEDANDPVYLAMQEACEELGVYAKSMNAFFAIETGPERASHLKKFLDSLTTNGVSVNFDPANMVMVTGDDPVEGIKLLKDYIVHTHVKDGVRYLELDPREVYGGHGYEPMSHEKIAAMGTEGKIYRELPLGEGNVDFDAYFAAIQEIGYTGYLTIEREAGANPAEDIRRAVEFIKRYK